MKLAARLTTSYRLSLQLLRQPGFVVRLLVIWAAVLAVFLWINRINLLLYIFTQSPLPLVGKILFFLGVYPAVVVNISNPVVLSTVIFAFLTAMNLLLLAAMIRFDNQVKANRGVQAQALTAAAGSHILSCGGTLLLSPLFPALAGAGALVGGGPAVAVNIGLGTFANIIGILIMVRSINKLSADCVMMSRLNHVPAANPGMSPVKAVL